MSNWDYGGTYKSFDMSGTIELPGGSVVQVCDWMESMPDFMKQADTLFIDPPWNMGNVRSFYTKADLDRPEGFDFLGLTEKLFQRVDEIAPEFLFIEMGKEFLNVYISECKKRFKYVTFYNSTYYKKAQNKCYVIHACNDFKRKRYKELEDLDERDIIDWLCANHEYQCIGDLCMGMGLVGQFAFDNGKQFVGTELNSKRLAKLVDYVVNKRTKKTA